MERRKLLFVFNPFSGKGQIKSKLFEIVDQFVKSGYEVTVYPTQKPQDAMELVKERAGKTRGPSVTFRPEAPMILPAPWGFPGVWRRLRRLQ